MRKTLFESIAVAALLFPTLSGGELVVASLNPIMGDLARQVGGDHVEVIDLMKSGMDPHTFRPTPEDLRKAEKADLVIFSGKGLEISLDDVRGNLSKDQELFEVGRRIPSLLIENDDPMFACCPNHAFGQIDPHWWHSIKNVIRATHHMADKMGDLDPENKEAYRQNAQQYREELEALQHWAEKKLSSIPRNQRSLVTSHLAYSYFCRDFGFKAIPLAGLNTQDSPTPNYLAQVVETIKKENIMAVFPEHTTNPAVLNAMVKETGVRVGNYLLAGTPDPAEPTYEAMMRHNVTTILDAFSGD